MVQEKPPISSRISLLEQTLLSGNVAAFDAFWQEVAEHGAPPGEIEIQKIIFQASCLYSSL